MLHPRICNRLGNLLRACCAALACLAVLPLPAVAADDERARLVQQRRTLSEAFAAEELACTQRFAVTACVDEIKLRRRESLAPLRERELQIDEAERARKAEERRAAIAAKRAAAASAPAASAAGLPELRLRQPTAAATATAPVQRPSAPARQDAQDRTAQAEQRARQGQQRRDEAAAAQQRVQRRQAARSASGQKSDPLPLPAASSAPRR